MLEPLSLSSEVKYLTIQELIDGFDNDTLLYTDRSNYIRNDKNLLKCQESLIFPESSEPNESGNIPAFVHVLEPILLEPLDGRKRLVNGNNRCISLLDFVVNPVKELLGDVYEITSFCDIPYRVFNRPLNDEEYIQYQVGLNDSTQQHNSYELALAIVRSKLKLENEYSGKRNKAGGLTKEAQSAIATKLSQLYRRPPSFINDCVTVVTTTSPVLKKYLIDGKISLNMARFIIQSATKHNIDADLATRNIIKSLSDDDALITKSACKLYFSDYEKAISKSVDTDTESSDAKSVDTETESSETESSDTNSVDTETESDNTSDSLGYITSVLDNLLSLEIVDDERLTFPLSEINKKMIKVIQISYPYLEIDEITKKMYKSLVDLSSNFTNIEGIDDSEVLKIVSAFKSLDKEISNFQKFKRQLAQSQVVVDF